MRNVFSYNLFFYYSYFDYSFCIFYHSFIHYCSILFFFFFFLLFFYVYYSFINSFYILLFWLSYFDWLFFLILENCQCSFTFPSVPQFRIATNFYKSNNSSRLCPGEGGITGFDPPPQIIVRLAKKSNKNAYKYFYRFCISFYCTPPPPNKILDTTLNSVHS